MEPQQPTATPKSSRELTTFTHHLFLNLKSFPRDQRGDYICVFRGCMTPILRTQDDSVLVKHTIAHAKAHDTILPSMLDSPDPRLFHSLTALIESESNATASEVKSDLKAIAEKDSFKSNEDSAIMYLANANSTLATFAAIAASANMLPAPSSNHCQHYSGDSSQMPSSGIGSSFGSNSSFSVPSPTAMCNAANSLSELASDGSWFTKPSPRAHQLNEQMAKYGTHLFHKDRTGKFVCFFQDCKRRMSNNFSRHIRKHEKMGDLVDSKYRGTMNSISPVTHYLAQPGSQPMHPTSPTKTALTQVGTPSPPAPPSPSPPLSYVTSPLALLALSSTLVQQQQQQSKQLQSHSPFLHQVPGPSPPHSPQVLLSPQQETTPPTTSPSLCHRPPPPLLPATPPQRFPSPSPSELVPVASLLEAAASATKSLRYSPYESAMW
ncbi:hypothetical protein Pelo_14357 [Pelomyxa schiedti]|nr:hypothetical protein Pelo_14357 [Pelomyxa schiedti]